MALTVDPHRVIKELRELANFGRCGAGVERRALTPIDVEARRWLLTRMLDAGLTAQIDAVGNVVGRTSHERRLLIGSHTDTVPKGGWLDGALGVIAGLEIARAVNQSDRNAAVGVEVVSFVDEEGYFHHLLGSKVFSGELSLADARTLRNVEGQTLAAALAAGNLASDTLARLDPLQHIAYLELHIEQGPVLETSRTQLGLVTDIVGIRQDRVTFFGEPNHAGTTPMNLRHDAAACLFGFAVDWAASCRALAGSNTVWNLGQIELDPGAHNVVAGRAVAICQYRDVDTERLQRMSAAIRESAAKAAVAHRTEFLIEEQAAVSPTAMHPKLINALEVSASALGATVRRMPSGAGHDAMIVGRHIPAGMLFVPSKGGVSHSMVEDTEQPDIRRGIEVLAGAVDQLTHSAFGHLYE